MVLLVPTLERVALMRRRGELLKVRVKLKTRISCCLLQPNYMKVNHTYSRPEELRFQDARCREPPGEMGSQLGGPT